MAAHKKKIAALSIFAAAILIVSAVFFDAFLSAETVEKSGFAMGSVITVSLSGTSDKAIADEILAAIADEEERYLSRYRENSEIFRLNKDGCLTVSDHTAQILEKSLEIAKNSRGAFDISIGALSSLWNFDSGSQTVPADSAIQAALSAVGYEKIKADGNTYIVPDGLTLDLGAVGKGIACDDALEILKQHHVDGAVISVGGTILTYGKNRNSPNWTIGIRTPEKDDPSYFAKLSVNGTAFLSTSGSYEKSFTSGDTLYHHILSTETGYPADSGLKSVTVLSDSGLLSDALSTACFALGREKSGGLLKLYNAQAIFITSGNTVYLTDGIFDDFELVQDSYQIQKYE